MSIQLWHTATTTILHKINSGTQKTNLFDNNKIENYFEASYNSDISDFITKTDFEYALTNKHSITFGIVNSYHTFNPGKNKYHLDNEEFKRKVDTSFTNQTLYANEPACYIEDQFKVSEKLTINYGTRISSFISDSNNFLKIEPRFSANYALTPQLVFKTGYSRMTQYIHLLSASGVSMPTDIWVPALKGLKPLESDQINAGFAYDWKNIALLSIELYHKWLYNTTDILDGVSMVADVSPWNSKTTQGNGLAKGIEISIDKQQGRLTGSIHYSLSSSIRKYKDINNGQTFPFKFDRKHDFNISANYQINEKWDISTAWFYGSGYRVTLPIETYISALGIYGENISGENVAYFPSRNNYRLPAYHRLDMGIHYKTTNRLGEHNLSFDIYNVYCRQNPINAYYNGDFNYCYLLPIIPSITYTFKF